MATPDRLLRYDPNRKCPRCGNPKVTAVLSYGGYYGDDDNDIGFYLDALHALRRCRACGAYWPEAIKSEKELQ